MNPIKAAVIGAGWVAMNRYLPVLKRMANVRVTGVADHNLDRAEHAANEFDARAFMNSKDIIASEPDVLFVCTSPFSHSSIAIDAMRRGVNVFVEKPMALDITQARDMVTSAAESQVQLGVSHNLLYSRSVKSALTRIRSGQVGDIRHVLAVQSSSSARRLPDWYPSLPGGLFFDEAPHMIYLLDKLIGQLTLDSAWSRRLGESGSIAAMGALFSGANDIRAEMTMIFNAPVSEWILTIICEAGVVVVDLFRDIEIVIPPDGDHGPREILRTSIAGMTGHGLGIVNTGFRYLAGRQFWGHDIIIRDFIDSARQQRSPTVTGQDGMRTVSVMADIMKEIERAQGGS
jgi:predicted dehydrogenase